MTCSAKLNRAQIHISEFATPFCRWAEHKKLNCQFKHLSCCGLSEPCWVSTQQEDFWDLGRNTLVDFLAVYGLRTSRRKAELIARAFLAVELKLPIIESSEKQQAKLKNTMQGDLKSTPYATHWVLKVRFQFVRLFQRKLYLVVFYQGPLINYACM